MAGYGQYLFLKTGCCGCVAAQKREFYSAEPAGKEYPDFKTGDKIFASLADDIFNSSGEYEKHVEALHLLYEFRPF